MGKRALVETNTIFTWNSIQIQNKLKSYKRQSKNNLYILKIDNQP